MNTSVVIREEKIWQTNFCFLFVSRFAKVLADNIASIAFVWLLVEMGGNATSTAIFSACVLVPQTLLSSFVTPLLSKGKLQHWMFLSDLVRMIVAILVPIFARNHWLPSWLFFSLVILQSASGAFYNPASVAILPKIVHKSKLQQANAMMQSSYEIVTLIGLTCAGLLISWLSTTTTMFLVAGLFCISAFVVLAVRTGEERTEITKQEEAETSEDKVSLSYGQRIREGFAIVRQHKLLFGLSLYALFMNIGVAPWTSLLALFVKQDLHGDASTLTLLRASSSIGALVMGIVLTRVKIRRQGALFILAGIIEGIMFSVIGAAPWMWLIVAATFIFGICLTAINVPEVVIIQTTVPQHQQAQVYSVIMTISVGLLPIGYLVAGMLADIFGNGPIIFAGGIIIVVSGIVVRFLTPLASMKVETS